MKKSDFKFELHQLVTHIVDSYPRNKMLIVTRYMEETADGIVECYKCSSKEMGQVVRQVYVVEELELIEE